MGTALLNKEGGSKGSVPYTNNYASLGIGLEYLGPHPRRAASVAFVFKPENLFSSSDCAGACRELVLMTSAKVLWTVGKTTRGFLREHVRFHTLSEKGCVWILLLPHFKDHHLSKTIFFKDDHLSKTNPSVVCA